jgi:hypothetical protein
MVFMMIAVLITMSSTTQVTAAVTQAPNSLFNATAAMRPDSVDLAQKRNAQTSDLISDEALASLETNLLGKPKVEATVWYFSLLGCTVCESLHHTVTTYLIGVDVIKAWKGGLHVYCMFFHDARSCMRFVETYTELIAMDIFYGVLGRNFTCTEVFKVCNTPYQRDTLRDYMNDTVKRLKTDDIKDDTYLDDFYTQEITYKQNNLITYPVLHISDLAVDLDYIAGSTAKCRQWRCCHLNQNNDQVKQKIKDKDLAYPFGHRKCDMPIGGTQAILHKLNAEIAKNYFEEPNLIIVTGGIVTEQPG